MTADIGDNSDQSDPERLYQAGLNHMAGIVGDNSRAQLKSIIERVENLTEEKQQRTDDIRDIFAEAKGNGFDVKALREIIRLRRQDADERAKREAVVDVYKHALGMLV